MFGIDFTAELQLEKRHSTRNRLFTNKTDLYLWKNYENDKFGAYICVELKLEQFEK